jgi:hypothetical protein
MKQQTQTLSNSRADKIAGHKATGEWTLRKDSRKAANKASRRIARKALKEIA